MKKFFSFALLAAVAYAIYQMFVLEQEREVLWQEATRDSSNTPHPGA